MLGIFYRIPLYGKFIGHDQSVDGGGHSVRVVTVVLACMGLWRRAAAMWT